MARQSNVHRLLAIVALIAVMGAQAAIVWALPCAGECGMSPPVAERVDTETEPGDAHSCCPDEPATDDRPRLLAPGCCGGDTALSCNSPALLPDLAGSAAHDRAKTVADRPALTGRAVTNRIRAQRLLCQRSSLPPAERHTTETIVLLL